MSGDERNMNFRKAVPALPKALVETLRQVRELQLKVSVRQFPAMLVVVFSLAWLLQGLVDRYVHLSWNVRAVLLALDGVAALVLLWQYLLLPVWRRLNHRRAALLIERKVPDFDSSLISVVEFCEMPGAFPMESHAVVLRLMDDVARRAVKPGLAQSVIDSKPLRKKIRWACIAGAILLAAMCVAGPRTSFLLGRRIFLSQVALPTDTRLIPLSGSFMVDDGGDAVLAVRVEGVIPPNGTIVIATGKDETSIPVPLTRAPEGASLRYATRNVRERFTYRFKANDGESPEEAVEVNVPPTLQSVKFVQTYPSYTGLQEAVMSPGNLRLMEGSTLHIEAVASQPLNRGVLVIKGDDKLVPMKKGENPANLSVDLKVPAKGWKTMSLKLDAGQGRVSSNEPVYRVEIVADRAPSASMTLPKKDRITVVPGEKVPLAFKAGDDFGLSHVALFYRVMRPDEDGQLTPVDQGQFEIKLEPKQTTLTGTQVLDLNSMVPKVPVGCTINCWLEATDNNSLKGLVKTVSKEKVIAVVSEAEKRMELLEQMEQRAKEVERLYDQQKGVNERSEETLRRNEH